MAQSIFLLVDILACAHSHIEKPMHNLKNRVDKQKGKVLDLHSSWLST